MGKNKASVFSTIGARNYAKQDRVENDFYATDPVAVRMLLEREKFFPKVWEPCSGAGHITKVLEQYNYDVMSTDIVDRGCCDLLLDFLNSEFMNWDGDIITNPPYKGALDFVKKAYNVLQNGRRMAFFLKIQFLEGKERRKFFDKYPPEYVYVFTDRIRCARNGEFDNSQHSSAVCFAWFIWRKGFKSDTIVRWL